MAASYDFQQRFIELTAELDLNKKTEIAKTLGITYTNFIKIYNYGIFPSVPVLVRIADYFRVSTDYLVGFSDNEFVDLSSAPESFSVRLKQLLEKHGFTVYELSRRSHIHRNNIAQWLHKGYLPTVDDLIVLTNVFDVSLDFLLGRSEVEIPLSLDKVAY